MQNVLIKSFMEIESGITKRFPRNSWVDVPTETLREFLTYVFENVCEYTLLDAKKNLDVKKFRELKIFTMLNRLFNGSPFQVLEFTYPGQVEPWEMKHMPRNLWTIKDNIEKAKEWIEETTRFSVVLCSLITVINNFILSNKNIIYIFITQLLDYIAYLCDKCHHINHSMTYTKNKFEGITTS